MGIVSSRALRWVVVVALAAPGAYAAEWSVQPSLVVGSDYDSNRNLASDPIGSEGLSMSGKMRLEHATERMQLLLLPEVELQRFSDRRFNRSDDGGLTADARWLGELFSFDLSGLLRDQSTLSSELLSTGYFDLHTRRRDEQAGGTWAYKYAERWQLALNAGYQSQRYHGNAATPLQDNTLTTLGVTEQYTASEQWALTASVSSGRYTTEQALFDTRSDSATLGFVWASSERNKVSGEIGWDRRSDRYSRSSGFVGELSVARSWETGNVSLSGGRSVTPSGFGVFSQTDQAVLTVGRRLSERLSLAGSLSWYRTSSAFESFDFEERTYEQVSLSLTWQANEYWSIGTNLQGNRSTSQLFNPVEGRGWRVGLLASWQPLEHALSR